MDGLVDDDACCPRFVRIVCQGCQVYGFVTKISSASLRECTDLQIVLAKPLAVLRSLAVKQIETLDDLCPESGIAFDSYVIFKPRGRGSIYGSRVEREAAGGNIDRLAAAKNKITILRL